MNRPVVVLLALALAFGGCARPSEDAEPEPTPEQEIDASLISDAALDPDDAGEKWDEQNDAAPSTIQIGGKVGPANLHPTEAEATSAFTEKAGSAYLTNNVFLLETTEMAQTWILTHEQADARESWTQDRKDGGSSRFKRTGRVKNLPSLGDANYSATVDVTITDTEGDKVKRKIEYVVYRMGRVLAFVITQDASVGIYARRQEQKVARLTA